MTRRDHAPRVYVLDSLDLAGVVRLVATDKSELIEELSS